MAFFVVLLQKTAPHPVTLLYYDEICVIGGVVSVEYWRLSLD